MSDPRELVADYYTACKQYPVMYVLHGRDDSNVSFLEPATSMRAAIDDGALDAPIRWVHSSDLADPTPFLSEGLALLTTGTQFLSDDPAAYDGLTMAGPIEMPAPIAALVALDEVVVHGWDLATGAELPATLDGDLVAAVADWFTDREELYRQAGAIGPRAEVPADASRADRLLAAFGRRPTSRR